MAASAELARLRRDLAELEAAIADSTGPRRGKPLLTRENRMAIRSELQDLIRQMDELANKLGG